jgi:geranylgeranyl pyrophosphate synthase
MSSFKNLAELAETPLFEPELSDLERFMIAELSDSESSSTHSSSAVQASLRHLASGGHRVRARLGFEAAMRLDLSRNDAIAIGAAAELLHNASLVHDDLQDEGMIRRGLPTVFAAFGADVAVLSGDLLLSSAYSAIAQFSRPSLIAEMIRLVHRRTAQVIRGQCGDLSARTQAVTDITRYEEIVTGKSGALLSLPLELALLGAGFRDALSLAQEAAESFGIGYQIVDDLDDAASDGPFTLNLLNVLSAEHSKGEANRLAREIGTKHLQFAISAANRLPRGSGELLGKLARALSERL